MELNDDGSLEMNSADDIPRYLKKIKNNTKIIMKGYEIYGTSVEIQNAFENVKANIKECLIAFDKCIDEKDDEINRLYKCILELTASAKKTDES